MCKLSDNGIYQSEVRKPQSSSSTLRIILYLSNVVSIFQSFSNTVYVKPEVFGTDPTLSENASTSNHETAIMYFSFFFFLPTTGF